MGSEDRDNRPGDLILNCEDIFELSIVALSPTMCARRSIDQLRRDADAVV
jgi:hypothetical protein